MRWHNSRRLLPLAALAFGMGAFTVDSSAQYAGAEPAPAAWANAMRLVNEQGARAHMEMLAGDLFFGRGTGQAGYMMSAGWVSGQFAKMGLKPAGDFESYLQFFPMTRARAEEGTSFIEGPGGFRLETGRHLTWTSMGGSVELDLPVLFLDIPAEVTAEAINQIGGDENRILVVNIHPDAPANARQIITQRVPSRGLFFVVDDPGRSAVQIVRRQMQAGRMVGRLSRDGAQELAVAMGNPTFFDAETDSIQEFQGVGSLRANLEVVVEEFHTANVIGFLEGSDPVLKDEIIMVTAHLDHMGQVGESIFYGADDNASGVVGLLKVAQMMTEGNARPKRSVLFIAFGAEEVGLVGARFYAENPVFPIENHAAIINMDMIGRNREEPPDFDPADTVQHLVIIGQDEISPELWQAVNAANRYINFELGSADPSFFFRSDQAALYRVGVPATFLHSGLHPDYHTVRDTIDRINYTKLVNAARLCFLMVHILDDMPRPTLVQSGN